MDYRKLSLLVAAPDPEQRRPQVHILKSMGFKTVLEVSNGTEAWAALKNKKVDAVVCTWDMPEMSGMALLKVVRADPGLFGLPILLIADSVTKSQVIEAGESGVSDILLRPITAQTFSRKIEDLLQLRGDPQAAEAQRLYRQGLTLMDQELWEEAIESFERILSVYENAEIYYNMGYIRTAQGAYEEAVHYFRKATQINNAFAQAYEKLGECYTKLGRNKLAEKAFQKAAEIFMDKEMDGSAEEVLLKVVELNPDTLNVYNSLGILYRRQGKYKQAIRQYQRALLVSPRDENVYYNIGRIYYEQNELEEASEILSKALEINPSFAEARDMLRSIKMRLGEI